jgi:hypothetical protein
MQFLNPSLNLDSSGESACEMGWDRWTWLTPAEKDEHSGVFGS